MVTGSPGEVPGQAAGSSAAVDGQNALVALDSKARKALQQRMDYRAQRELEPDALAEYVKLKGTQKKTKLLEIFFESKESIGCAMSLFLKRERDTLACLELRLL